MAELWHIIHRVGNLWQYDDGNYANLPSATTDLTSGTYKYALPIDALTINKCEILDRGGKLVRLNVLDDTNIGSVDYTVTGQPTHYSLVNGTAKLYPCPDYSATNGLKWSYDRAGVDFDYDDTTQEPGFPSPYHYLVSLGMAIDYLKTKQPNSPSLSLYIGDYNTGKLALEEFISERFEDNGTPTLQTTRQDME